MEGKSDKSPYIMLALEFDKYKTMPTAKHLKRKSYEPINKNLITAFIPGTIRKVTAREGKKVTKGTLLLILDAMKMNNQLFAEHTGVIKKVHVKEGDQVSKNQVLVEFA
ncbi:MAG: acetyl-CoA carboxylase biotin carboxyl carrier protein subunit [Bacteroidetes bacterium]|nr:acetyl-CoA carboxylase biotin carboxyl carrier protein subunit [Bacteroidota bacterium]